jgi:ribonucleoside-diphosphate reductase alpha chain
MQFHRLLSSASTPVENQITWTKTTSRITDASGNIIFEMLDVEHPQGWSKNAVDILAQKYFRKAGVPNRTILSNQDFMTQLPTWLLPSIPDTENLDFELGSEISAKQVFHRLAGAWTYWGWKEGIFAKVSSPEESAQIFYDELYLMLAFQIAAPNSPQWFNTGLHWAYGIEGSASGQWAIDEKGLPYETTNAYEHPQPHACFIQPVSDDLVNPSGIMDLWQREVRLFKQGSGTGSNFSQIRGKGERLSGGGVSSGLMSFLEIGDVSAKSIKSGGVCLAPDQYIYTERGPIQVKQLADSKKDFVVISWDPPANRYKAKTARAFPAGNKELVLITTDKGQFKLSTDHPVLLQGNLGYVHAEDLQENQSIFACSIDDSRGYIRIGLHDGQKGKDVLHRLVAKDILNWDIEGNTVHHVDEDKHNCDPTNLELLSQNEHAYIHGKNLASQGIHVFQTQKFEHSGENNGMHKNSDFWQDEVKVDKYKLKQSNILHSRGDAKDMQENAASQRMLNMAFKVKNLGGDISTLKDYLNSRERLVGRIGDRQKISQSVIDRFGNWNNFLGEMNRLNHKVISIQKIGISDVYDVEVDCPTLDDKSLKSGHNFVIWSDDSFEGSGIVVSNTRRAAKMCVLDLDHPEILEFINWKAREEYKAYCMHLGSHLLSNTQSGVRSVGILDINPSIQDRIDNGFAPELFGIDWQGEAVTSVSGQNSNNSVRITDKFLKGLSHKDYWELKNRTDRKVSKVILSTDLWHQLCRSAWACGDPGVQFEDLINTWHTCKADGRINASNPCSEYLFLDNTACNLASLNLVKFLNSDGSINTKLLLHAVRLWTTVLEISVFMASFPSKEIALGSYNYRTLGLGYANLGSLLMQKAIPYDSDSGRNLAATLTAIIHGQSYLTSFEMGSELGPFPRYEANKESFNEVIEMHCDCISGLGGNDFDLIQLVTRIYDDLRLCSTIGSGPRNAQVTNIAPTGTISFVMDCDTTGCEPNFQQISFKSLAGGGDIILENQSVAKALQVLGYTPAQVLSILQHIKETGTIETWTLNGRHLPDEHLQVFDCANPGTGKRFISFLGHIKMVAAIQPFISGGISKTINLPNHATIEDVSEAYLTAHKLGVKSIALYRDGSKLDQPLKSTAKQSRIITPDEVRAAEKLPPPELIANIQPNVISINSPQLPRGHRVRLPNSGQAFKDRLQLDGHTLYIIHGLYPDGKLGEIFLELSKEGSTVRALLNAFAKAVSIGIQFGVPLEKFVESFVFTKFEPSGIVEGHYHVKMASSLLDLIFRVLAIKYLGQLEYSNLEAEDIQQSLSTTQASSYTSLSAAAAPKQIMEECQFCKTSSLIRVGPSCSFCTNCKMASGCG